MTEPTNTNLRSRVEQLLLADDSLSFLQDELTALGPQAVPLVIDIARQSQRDTKFKERALILLGRLGGDEALQFVASQLVDTDEMVKVASLTALRQIGDTEHMSTVTALLTDESSVVRKEAIKTLALLGDSSSLVSLKKLAQSEEQDFLKDQLNEAIEQIERRTA
jgi:HEAT repeat protein